ncbi:MAG: aminoacetone oxidase family FAD-binding enzyme [Clostridia bacterium]|nr:aminoacetone oxidase family FAD-binding enzyme [Clostridia bacterium]
MHTLIIGGGAAGMAAAIACARKGDRVTVVERGRKPMKKLGVTGNGRGNLLNAGAPCYYGSEDFALDVLRHMPYENIAAFLRSCGIALALEDEGRIYPASFLAASAVDALMNTAQDLGVSFVLSTRVTRVEPGFAVHAVQTQFAPDTVLKSGRVKPGAPIGEQETVLKADRVIVAAGGAASPAHLTDGTAYGLLTAFGHELIPPRPALCALTTEKAPIEGLSGQRARAALVLDGQFASQGEILFADDGVSGIAAMQLARFVKPGSRLVIDLREAVMGEEAHMDVDAWLASRPARRMSSLLTGAASPQLASALLRAARIRPDSAPDAASIHALAQVIRRFEVSVTGTRGFEAAQVTAGGISCAQFDPATMESRLCPGLHAAGEVLDVDGACGGFNLMFAFACGLLCAQ